MRNKKGVAIGASMAAAAAVLVGGGIALGAQPQTDQLDASPVAWWHHGPDKPAGTPSVRLFDGGSTTMKVAWTPVRGASRYRLSWVDLDTTYSWTGSKPDYGMQSSPVTLTGLRRGHLYRVTVTPYNQAGFGTAGSAVRPTEGRNAGHGGQHDARPGAVGSVTLSYGGNSSSLKLTWTPAPGADRYRIGWRDTDTGEKWQSSGGNYGAGDSPVTLTGLRPEHHFEAWVTPYNGAGDGPTSRVTGHTEGRTLWGPPREVASMDLAPAGAHALKVGWTPGASPFGPEGTRFRISWRDTTSGRTWTSSGQDYGVKDSPVTLTGLDTGHHYVVTVTPYVSGAGDGPSTSRQADVA